VQFARGNLRTTHSARAIARRAWALDGAIASRAIDDRVVAGSASVDRLGCPGFPTGGHVSGIRPDTIAQAAKITRSARGTELAVLRAPCGT
jgi:hypothetical protein